MSNGENRSEREGEKEREREEGGREGGRETGRCCQFISVPSKNKTRRTTDPTHTININAPLYLFPFI